MQVEFGGFCGICRVFWFVVFGDLAKKSEIFTVYDLCVWLSIQVAQNMKL